MDRSVFQRNHVAFTLGDYLVFIFSLFLPMVIGMYYAWRGASSSTFNYLLGRKQMGVFSIAMSLSASSVSASLLLGVPNDVYLTGSMYWWIVVAMGFSIPVSLYIYLPVFHQLKLTSVNQYLEMRFNSTIRRLIALLYVVTKLLYLAFLVYGPSVALKRVTGLEEHISISIAFAVSIFYTAIGGFKAVVWTGTIQIFFMYGSIMIVLIKGIIDVGGLDTVFLRNLNSSRIEFFNFDSDPTARHTVWSLSIGGFFLYTSMYATDQVFVQRSLALSTLRKAGLSQWLNLLVVAGIISLCCLTGLVTYAYYFDCDPHKTNRIGKAEDVFLLFIIDTIGKFPGLPGFFVAGVFSGSLSILSSSLNSVALIVLEDFVRPFFPTMQDTTTSLVTKMTSIIFGCLTFSMVFAVSQIHLSLDASLSFAGAIAGVILGVFSLGMFVPWANATGAGVGTTVSLAFMIWLGISTEIAKTEHLIQNPQIKWLSGENCRSFNSTVDSSVVHFLNQIEEPLALFRISYMWSSMIGMFLVLTLGTVVSFLSGPQDPGKLNPKLLCNFMHRSDKTTLQLVEEIPETDNATAISRSRNGIMLWELPTQHSTHDGAG